MATLVDSLLNAAAVWFALKAVEAFPLGVFDTIQAIRRWIRRKRELDTTDEGSFSDKYDSNRGKLEYILSGEGFLKYRLFTKSKKWFLISTLVPLVIFVLELFSIFLGTEVTTCETSTDPNIVSAPSLQLFEDGERDFAVYEVNNQIVGIGRTRRPCLDHQSKVNGVEYLASICTDLLSAAVPIALINQQFPNHKFISVAILTATTNQTDLTLAVLARPSNETFEDIVRVGSLNIFVDVLVNGKNILISDPVKEGVVNERIRQQIRNDVKEIESSKNLNPSRYSEVEGVFLFEWGNTDDFILGVSVVTTAVMAQSRIMGIRTATEMSNANTIGFPRSYDISCQEEFILSKTLSIVIIATTLALRVLLLIAPSYIASAEFALVYHNQMDNVEPSVFFMDNK